MHIQIDDNQNRYHDDVKIIATSVDMFTVQSCIFTSFWLCKHMHLPTDARPLNPKPLNPNPLNPKFEPQTLNPKALNPGAASKPPLAPGRRREPPGASARQGHVSHKARRGNFEGIRNTKRGFRA